MWLEEGGRGENVALREGAQPHLVGHGSSPTGHLWVSTWSIRALCLKMWCEFPGIGMQEATGSQSVAHGPAAFASIVRTQILGPHPRPTELEALGWAAQQPSH